MLRVLWFADCEAGDVGGGTDDLGDAIPPTAVATPEATSDPGAQEAASSPSSPEETPALRRERRACGMLRVLATELGMAQMWRVGFPLLDALSESLMALLTKHEPDVAGRLKKNGLPALSLIHI